MLRGVSDFLRMSRAGHEVAMGMFQRWRCWIEGKVLDRRHERGAESGGGRIGEPGGIEFVRSKPLNCFGDRGIIFCVSEVGIFIAATSSVTVSNA